MPYRGIIGEIKLSRWILNGLTLKFEWRIPNFLDLSNEVSDFYESPRISFYGARWFFIIFPNCMPSGCVNLHLLTEGLFEFDTFSIKVGIKRPDGIEKRNKVKVVLLDKDCCWLHPFCTRSQLIEQKQSLMPNDGLTIACGIDLMDADGADEESDDGELMTWPGFNNDDLYEDQSDDEDQDPMWKFYHKQKIQAESAKRRIETLAKDFCKLLSDSEDKNVTIQVGEVELKAHRSILMARSPVLSAMLGHDTSERALMKISICDCRPEVFRQYLHYIYTGSAEILSEENVFDLYRVADKYLADGLKEQCLTQVIDTLSVQTFCDAVKLALMYRESRLLDKITTFAAKNVPSIKSSVQWQDFEREYPAKAKEALVRFLDEDKNPKDWRSKFMAFTIM